MKKEIFDTIKKKYCKHSSFAVWNDNDLSNLSVIEKNIRILKPNILIVGLNASGTIKCFSNFHCKHRGGRDVWLKEAFNHSIFRGSYMTDIIKNDLSSRMTDVDLSEDNIKLNIKKFREELNDLKSKNPIIISIGNETTKILREHLKPLKLYPIPHYARPGIKKEEFIRTVKKVENLIKNKIKDEQ